ncbi:MAG: rhodanese-like domain-containing protein [Actinomycetes bacterium]
MKRMLAVILVSVFALSGCGGSAGKVTTLNAADFAAKIADKSIVLVDVRTPSEFASGHISGATNIDFESGSFESDIKKLDKSKVYAVYCRSGNRSGQATALMAKNGFATIFNLEGGIINWQNAGETLMAN